MELDVRPEVFVRDYHTKAKGYPGANHFRLLNVDMNRISAALAANPALGGFLLGPYENGSSFLYGPTNETPECFDLTQFGKTMASMGPK